MFKKKVSGIPEQDKSKLEDHLGAVLREINPNAEFRQRLSDQLMRREIKPYIAEKRDHLRRTLLITGGVIGSLLIVATSIRTVLSIFGILKLAASKKGIQA